MRELQRTFALRDVKVEAPPVPAPTLAIEAPAVVPLPDGRAHGHDSTDDLPEALKLFDDASDDVAMKFDDHQYEQALQACQAHPQFQNFWKHQVHVVQVEEDWVFGHAEGDPLCDIRDFLDWLKSCDVYATALQTGDEAAPKQPSEAPKQPEAAPKTTPEELQQQPSVPADSALQTRAPEASKQTDTETAAKKAHEELQQQPSVPADSALQAPTPAAPKETGTAAKTAPEEPKQQPPADSARPAPTPEAPKRRSVVETDEEFGLRLGAMIDENFDALSVAFQAVVVPQAETSEPAQHSAERIPAAQPNQAQAMADAMSKVSASKVARQQAAAKAAVDTSKAKSFTLTQSPGLTVLEQLNQHASTMQQLAETNAGQRSFLSAADHSQEWNIQLETPAEQTERMVQELVASGAAAATHATSENMPADQSAKRQSQQKQAEAGDGNRQAKTRTPKAKAAPAEKTPAAKAKAKANTARGSRKPLLRRPEPF